MEEIESAASEATGDAVGGLDWSQAVRLQQHAFMELMANNVPSTRCIVVRTMKVAADGKDCACSYQGCTQAGCRGNRLEVATDRFYVVTDPHVHRRPTPPGLEFFEPQDHATLALVSAAIASPGGGSGSGSGMIVHGASTSIGHNTGGSAGAGAVSGMAPGAATADVHASTSATTPAGGGSGGWLSTALGWVRSGDQGVAAPDAATSPAVAPAELPLAPDDLTREPDQRAASTSGRPVPMMRAVYVHWKTSRFSKPFSYVLPFNLARAMHRWIKHGRPVLTQHLVGTANQHEFLFVQPSNSLPMTTAAQLNVYWRGLQADHHAPFLHFPPSAFRDMFIGGSFCHKRQKCVAGRVLKH